MPGPTVPDYQQQIQPDTAVVPHANIPQDVPEAFGANVGEAIAGFGQKVQASSEDLQNHAIERLKQEQEMAVYNGEMNLRDKANKMRNSTDMITIKDQNGNNLQVPQGILNRFGSSAKGSYEEFQNNFKSASDDFQNSFKTASQRRLASYLSQRLQGYYSEDASKHEAVQTNLAFQNDNINVQQSNVQLAGGTTDPVKVAELMGSNQRLQILLAEHKGLDPNVEGKDSIDSTKGLVLQSSLTKALQDNAGDVTQAIGLLNILKAQISPQKYDQLSDYIDKTSKSMQAQKQLADTQNFVNNRLSMFSKIGSGAINAQNLPQAIATTATTDPKLAEAMQTVVDNKYNFQPNYKDKEGVTLQKILKNMVDSEDQKSLTDTMTNDLHQNGKDLTSDTLATYVQAAVDMSSRLPCTEGANTPVNPQQDKVNAGLNSVIEFDKKNNVNDASLYNSYFKDVKNKVDPQVAVDNAKKNWILSKYPETLETGSPNQVIGADQKTNIFHFNPNTKISPHVIFKPKKAQTNE